MIWNKTDQKLTNNNSERDHTKLHKSVCVCVASRVCKSVAWMSY